jgi:hypothetical protein
VALRWTAAGSAVRIRSAAPVPLAGASALALRLIVPPNTGDTRLDVALTDTSGHRAVLGRVHLDGLPGTNRTASHWGQEVRIPLTAATRARVDLNRVESLELVPRTRSGQAWLIDSWGWRAGTPAVVPAELPRVDIGRLNVEEGDSGARTYRVPVKVSGHGSGKVRLFVADPATGRTASREVTVRPGGRTPYVKVEVRGNTRFGYDVSRDVFVKAVHGAVVGAHSGGVTARNDDPTPTMSVTPSSVRAAEGRDLTWRVSLSAVADADFGADVGVLPVTGGAELSTTDVDPDWLRNHTGESPLPARPLSEVSRLFLFVEVPAGRTSATVTIPTATDNRTEPDETVRLRLTVYDDSGESHGGAEFTGTVHDPS